MADYLVRFSAAMESGRTRYPSNPLQNTGSSGVAGINDLQSRYVQLVETLERIRELETETAGAI